jgi:hypothetical protein
VKSGTSLNVTEAELIAETCFLWLDNEYVTPHALNVIQLSVDFNSAMGYTCVCVCVGEGGCLVSA